MEEKEDGDVEEEETSSIVLTVSELIDNAFGDPEVNIVHHKQLQTVLYILARQLRILERRVEVQLTPFQVSQKSSSVLSVTEVKLQTTTTVGRVSIDAGPRRAIRQAQKRWKGNEELTSSDMTSSDKSRSSKNTSQVAKPTTKIKSLRDKTPNIGRSSFAVMMAITEAGSSGGKKSTGGKTSTTDKTSTAPASTMDETSTADRTSIIADDKSSDKQTTVGKRSNTTVGSRKMDPQDYHKLLDKVEEERERELRVIRQRADSREEHEKTPTPIASMDSVEAKYEKLLVVERVPAQEAAARAAREKSGSGTGSQPHISVVTLEQFKALASVVYQLQKKFQHIGALEFPENAELMQELRRGASLTDAMAALQLSARLEATEKMLNNLLSLVTDMATKMPEVKSSRAPNDDIEVLFGAQSGKKKKRKGEKSSSSKAKSDEDDLLMGLDVSPVESATSILMPPEKSSQDGENADAIEPVTYKEFQQKLQAVYDDIMQQVSTATTRSIVGADAAMKAVTRLEGKIEASLNLGSRMDDLEELIANYADQINALDTGLSSQLTYFQEMLTQMQHELESGLESMAEVLANTGGDATAVAELNAHFNDLQFDIDDTVVRQNELKDIQYTLSRDLEALRKEIELLRETKSDREEVVDALRDKAGLGDLNGLISLLQFDAVRGDLEKRFAAAYDKFNNQEIVWQKAIDDLLRELNEKADIIQVDSLRDEINRYLEILRQRMQCIIDIVGEPVAAALTRKLNRDAACLSCSHPAHMEREQSTLPSLPAMKPSTFGAEAPKPTGDGDHVICIPGQPVRHQIDPRAHVCNRWCGGSHTLIDTTKSLVPPSVTITPLNRSPPAHEQGTDGKMYAVEKDREPCKQCNAPGPTQAPATSKHILHEHNDDIQSDMTSYDMHPAVSAAMREPQGDETPPPTLL